MIVRNNRDIESEYLSDAKMSLLEDCSDVKVVEPIHEVALVTRHALNIHPKENGDMEQREHIFYIKCHINDHVCSMIIDSGSYINVTNTLLIEKLNFKKHPNPYKLQCLNVRWRYRVTKQVLVLFSIDKYKDEVLCDVAPIRASIMDGLVRPIEPNNK